MTRKGMSRTARAWLAVAAVLSISPLRAPCGTVAEKELLLRNTLARARPPEIVTVSLRELGLTPEQESTIRDVEVLDENGAACPAQLDAFGHVPGFSSEVALEIELAPLETRLLTVRLLDSPPARAGAREACRVQVEDDVAQVTTRVYTAPVRDARGNGLFVEQPRLVKSADQKDEDAIDALLGDVLDAEDGPDVGAALSARGGNMPQVKPPMSDAGLPFCVQGVWGFSPKARFMAWGGPVRAVVSLLDADSPWRVGDSNLTRQVRQTFWFPHRGTRFHLDVVSHSDQAAGEGRLSFGGIRINSADHEWQLVMGQDRSPPWIAPVTIPLHNTRRSIYLEGYQKSSFNHVWATLSAPPAWLSIVVDRAGSRFGSSTQWGSGARQIDSILVFADPGPFGNSVQPIVKFDSLPANFAGRLRVAYLFGTGSEAGASMRAESEQFAASPVVLPVAARERTPAAADRIAELADSHPALVIVPDACDKQRAALWERLADRLGGLVRSSHSVLHFYNTMHGGRAPASVFTVFVGEPGNNPLMDAMNRRHGVIDPYPAREGRAVRTLLDGAGDEGPVLFVSGNRAAATDEAVGELIARLPPRPAHAGPPVTVAACEWEDRMPFPWSGLRPHQGAFEATALRGGCAEFLFLLRTRQAVGQLTVRGPAGSRARYTLWKFKSESTGEERVVPLHDAVVDTLPDRLPADALISVWISLPIAPEAEPGLRREQAVIACGDTTRTVELAAEILAPTLPAERALGFYPMGFSKSPIRMYFDWDDDTYYRRLPELLRQRAEFGANAFSFELDDVSVTADAEGRLTIDASALEREVAAVREAGCVDLLELRTFNKLCSGRELAKVIKARGLADEFEAWEYVIPEWRAALRRLGLEGKAACRHGDEIADYEAWLGYAKLYRRCGVDMTVAINGYGVFNKQLGVGTMGLWMPLYNFYLSRWGNPIEDDDPTYFSRRFRDERRAAGEAIWPYVCGPGPYAWSSRPRSQARFLILDTYMKGADGLCYYGGTVWSHALDPKYRDTVKAPLRDADCTFTTLFYPDAAHGRLLPSLRAAAFKIGLEDAAAVKALRLRGAQAGTEAEVEAAIQEAYAKLTMDAPAETFNAFRRRLDALWREL